MLARSNVPKLCAVLIAALALVLPGWLKSNPQEYLAALGQTPTKVFVLNPGDKIEF